MTPIDSEEKQEINHILVIKKIWNENGPMEPNETRVRVETEITDEERLIID